MGGKKRSTLPTSGPHDVSFEIGASFIPAQTEIEGLNDAEKQVLGWLRKYKGDIAEAEKSFRVDRRAVAGAIAWEMLENVRSWSPRSVGPGKVHLYNYSAKGAALGLILSNPLLTLDYDTVATQTEERGYLPRQSDSDRRRILATPAGAISYIAGIMAAIADIAAQYGHGDIRQDPVILTNVYQSKTLNTWDAHVRSRKRGGAFVGGNPMDIWVASHLPFLEDGVGRPNLPESGPLNLDCRPSIPDASSPDRIIDVVAGSTLSRIAEAEYGNVELWPLIWEYNKVAVGSNPNVIHPGLRLAVAPLTRYTHEQIAEAKRQASMWRRFK